MKLKKIEENLNQQDTWMTHDSQFNFIPNNSLKSNQSLLYDQWGNKVIIEDIVSHQSSEEIQDIYQGISLL